MKHERNEMKETGCVGKKEWLGRDGRDGVEQGRSSEVGQNGMGFAQGNETEFRLKVILSTFISGSHRTHCPCHKSSN